MDGVDVGWGCMLWMGMWLWMEDGHGHVLDPLLVLLKVMDVLGSKGSADEKSRPTESQTRNNRVVETISCDCRTVCICQGRKETEAHMNYFDDTQYP